MGTENEASGTNGAAVAEAPKKTRKARPLWLLVPVKGAKTYEVFICHGAKAARKLLQDQGIDATDERLAGLKMLRGDEIVLTVSKQVVFKFGKLDDDAGDDAGDE
jgi:hypothetical protein